MKIQVISSLLFLLMLSMNTFAQNEIPNAGFETWDNETQPERWSTGNNLGGIIANAITRTSTVNSGQFAARGEILDSPIAPGNPWLPSLWLGMISNTPPPISQNYTYLSGKYILQNVNEFNATLQIQVNFLDANMEVTAVGHEFYVTASKSFIDFEVLMDYENTPSNNDAAYIQIIIDLVGDDSDPNYGIGSYFIVDDLELTSGTTSVGQLTEEIPKNFKLLQNYPNPFNPSTEIRFAIPKSSNVKLDIFNLLGQKVTSLVNENLSIGSYQVNWNGKDNIGNSVSSGIYFYTLKAGNISFTKKMILAK